MKEYLKREWKEMLAAFGVSALILIISLIYVDKIGGPITEARNLYNQGVNLYNAGQYDDALLRFEQSNQLWYTAETDNYIQIIKNTD